MLKSLLNKVVGLHDCCNRSSRSEVFCQKGVLRNFAKFTGKDLCQSLFFNKVKGLRPAILLKKKSLVHVFSCEFCEISKNNFFIKHLRVTASVQRTSQIQK